MKPRAGIACAALCFVLALFFRFALIGYTVMALLFAFLGALILTFMFLRRKGCTKLIVTLLVLLCIGATLFAAAEIPVIMASAGDDSAQADYIIVLGAGVNGSRPSLSLVNRLTKALEYLEAHPTCTAIVSGGQGQGEDLSEAQAMFIWLTERGISPERIIREDKATSTEENLRFSFAIIGEEAAEKQIAVVSSEYHLYRAQYMAREMGIETSGLAGRTSYPVLMTNYFIREAFAVWYLWIFGI